MTARTYDTILTVSSVAGFKAGNNIIGASSLTTGTIAEVDSVGNRLKVKLANLQQEFNVTETIRSNAILVATNANAYINSYNLPFQPNVVSGESTTSSATINAIAPSTFIAEKNAFTQNPVVRLYSIYYPGEWYPPNANGNPTGPGAGYAWPSIFPIRLAEIVGDKAEDISYNVTYGGISYMPYPVNLSGLEQGSDGKINELSLTVYNTDNIISYLVENPYLSGINTSNSVYAVVNGELVYGIDPRTVSTSTYSDPTAQAAMNKARASNLRYSVDIVGYYGSANAMFDKTMTTSVGGTWAQQKMDTRDLLGAAVEVRTTFANFLDYWPEYGLFSSATNNVVSLTNTLPYRVGDTLKTSSPGYVPVKVVGINSDTSLVLDKPIVKFLNVAPQESNPEGATLKPDGTKLYVIGSASDAVREYTLNTPWDISTAVYNQQFSVSAQETASRSVRFNDSGQYMYILGATNDNIYRYTLSVPWNIATATVSQSFNIAPYDLNSTGLAFDSVGSNVYFIGTNSDNVHQFTMTTPWDLTTANLTQKLETTTKDSIPGDLYFKPDGTKLYILGYTNDKIYQYNLSNAWNIATAAYSVNSYVGSLEGTGGMLAFNDLGDKVYFGGSATDNVYQATLTIPWDIDSMTTPLQPGDPLYIVNQQADKSSYLIDNYKIDQLEGLSEQVATFGLVSWLQYFKIVTPKRKYYKNTCQWLYKGPECQYPGPGVWNVIPGSVPTKYANANPIALDNSIATDITGDKCAKSLLACTLRNNDIHFGGFPGVGRSVPQM